MGYWMLVFLGSFISITLCTPSSAGKRVSTKHQPYTCQAGVEQRLNLVGSIKSIQKMEIRASFVDYLVSFIIGVH